MGRKRVRRHIVKGIPVRESIEYKIVRLRKELDMTSTTKYQLLIFGDGKTFPKKIMNSV